MRKAVACAFPQSSTLLGHLARVDYSDSFEIPLIRTDLKMHDIHVSILGHTPAGFKFLLYVRTKLVAPFGIRGPTMRELMAGPETKDNYAIGEKIGRWKVFARDDQEIITGGDDKHLDFRVSVLRVEDRGVQKIVLSTAVMMHNAFGRAYLAAIIPFHKYGVAHLMTNAAAAGRL
jgi:hypothetical protein